MCCRDGTVAKNPFIGFASRRLAEYSFMARVTLALSSGSAMWVTPGVLAEYMAEVMLRVWLKALSL